MLFTTLPMGYLQVVLPLYLNRTGLEPAFIGLLYTVSGFVTAVLVAFSGVLADRFGRRHFFVWGTALPILSYAVFASTNASSWLIVASVLGGVGLANGAAGALTTAAFDALLAEHTLETYRTRIFAAAQALYSLALALGAALSGLPEWMRQVLPAMTDLDAYRPPFVLLMLLAWLATLVALPVRESQVASVAPRTPGGGWLPRRSRAVILRYSLAVGAMGFGLGVAVQLMPLWFNLRFGVDETILGPWYAVSQVLSIGGLVVATWLERRFGAGRCVLVAQLLGALLLALMVVAITYQVAALLFVIRNVFANVSWPLQQTLLMSAVPPEERASAAGLGFAVWGFANALGPVVGGALMDAGSLNVPLLIGAPAYAFTGIVFGLWFRRPAPRGDLAETD